MADPISFLDAVAGYQRAGNPSSAEKPVRIATIDPAYDPYQYYPDPPQLPMLTFEGESTMSTKRYAYVNGFVPAAGQRVYLVPVGTTYMIAGAVSNPNMQGFHANPTTGDYSTEFGDGNYIEVISGVGNLNVDNIHLDGNANTGGQRGYLLSKMDIVRMAADQTITAAETDLNGATVTFNTLKANAKWKVSATFNFENTTGGTTAILVGKLMVDGVTQNGQGVFWSNTGFRVMVPAHWCGTFAGAGSHTIKLRANVIASAGVPYMYHTHTNFIYEIFE